ncbi:hypothetical protein ACFQL7_27805 [Halocatena marina]|uniref:Uncharacterized protein n=1 Tax=Halocatena marina TaxID=2934937 RepID=A0ABD5YYL1_9EURY
MSFLSSLFGTSKRSTGTYTCDCGAPMENTATYSRNEYRKELWECTQPKEDCLEIAEVYLFEDESDSYGTGCLKGEITGESK